MKHYASPEFWALYHMLPPDVRGLADKNFELLKVNPHHPSLHSKRVGLSHRVLGVEVDDGLLWFWIGSHAAYNRILK